MLTRTKGWFIRQTPMLLDLPEREQDLLDQVSESLDLRRKTIICEEGDPASSIYLVRAGIVKLSKTNDEGR